MIRNIYLVYCNVKIKVVQVNELVRKIDKDG